MLEDPPLMVKTLGMRRVSHTSMSNLIGQTPIPTRRLQPATIQLVSPSEPVMPHFHAVVWIDHQKATIWQFSADEKQETVVHAHEPHQRAHSRKSTHGG